MKDITAAILVIGDEILSGRTKDKNIGHIAECFSNIGVYCKEVRIVPDEESKIIGALNELRKDYTYVMTTGGIGPTHDDITADCVAKAFGVEISENEDAINMLLERIPFEDLNESRRRMARIPHGARLIENNVSKAPGFQIDNVFVMAGVPAVMQAMLDVVITRIDKGQKLITCNISTNIKEGDIADILREIQNNNPNIMIGSYPYYTDDGYGANIVCRAKNLNELKNIASIIERSLSAIGNVKVGEFE